MPGSIQTLGHLFLHSVARQKPDHLLVKQDGEYAPLSSEEFYRRVVRLHLRLRQLGLEKGDRCALLSENRWEWAAADFAMMTAGIVSVPLYATLTGEQLHYMLENSGARAILVSTRAQREKVEAICDRLPELRHAICFDAAPLVSEDPVTEAEQQKFQAALEAVGHGDLASIIYTSGTTGTPKGVMLTHANLVSNVLDTEAGFGADEVALSFLPLCHIYERMVDYTYYYYGVTVAHLDKTEDVAQTLEKVRPTLLAAVSRLFSAGLTPKGPLHCHIGTH